MDYLKAAFQAVATVAGGMAGLVTGVGSAPGVHAALNPTAVFENPFGK